MVFNEHKLHQIEGKNVIDGDMIPTRNHQIFDDMLDLQREFGAMMRFQRDLDGRIP